MMSTAPAAQPPGVADREMLVELVGLHAQALRRMPWVQTWLVVGLGLLIFRHVNGGLFVLWGASSVAVEFARSRYAARILRLGGRVDAVRVHAEFAVLAAVAGGAIGVGAVLFLPKLAVWDQATFAVVLLAIPAAGVAVSQSSRYILAAYAACILVPSGATWGWLYPGQALGVGSLIGLLLAVLILLAADGERLLVRSVAIRHERDQLVVDLEQRNSDVRRAMVEVQRAMAQAEQSAHARARVLAAASHDLRQPLQALSVYCAVLASRPAPELLSEVSGNIDQIVRSLGNLLNGLLDLSRLSAGYYVPERTQVRLDSLILGVCAEFDQAAAQKGLSLTHSLGPVQLLGDPVAIGRIARNLLDNAIKYTDQGSVAVAVRTETIDTVAHAVLSVTDTGRGIAESEHERIFEEFYQLDNPGRDRSRGVGLGLAIVHRLCEMGGAQVAVDSVVGQGSCFRVTLGAALATSAAPDPSPPQAAQDLLRGKRVYVVDDEIDIRKSMDTLLGIWGIQALTADSPPALGLLFEHHGTPDLLIVDLRLGDAEHGTRLAHRLQAQYGEFGVLIITGETSSEALRHANERNYPLLQKPVVPEVLRRAIMEAFNASAVSAR